MFPPTAVEVLNVGISWPSCRKLTLGTPVPAEVIPVKEISTGPPAVVIVKVDPAMQGPNVLDVVVKFGIVVWEELCSSGKKLMRPADEMWIFAGPIPEERRISRPPVWTVTLDVKVLLALKVLSLASLIAPVRPFASPKKADAVTLEAVVINPSALWRVMLFAEPK